MREIFRGRRRTVGVASLLMGLVVFGALMRSTIITDTLWINSGARFHYLQSSRGFFCWHSRPTPNPPTWKWSSEPNRYDEDIGSWTRIIRREPIDPARGGSITIAYWPFVAALTMTSAYLIVCKPRNRVNRHA